MIKTKIHKSKKIFVHRREGENDSREMRTVPQRVAICIAFVVFLIYAVTLIYPFFYIVMNAFKRTSEFTSNFNGLPQTWTFENFISAIRYRTPTTRFSIPEMFFSFNEFINPTIASIHLIATKQIKHFLYTSNISSNEAPTIFLRLRKKNIQ